MAIIQPLKKLFNWQTANEKIPYNIYTALLTQSGTAAPVATVLENTIGNITWVYEGVGQYSISIPGYNKEKLIVFAGSGTTGITTEVVQAYTNSFLPFGVWIDTYSDSGVSADDILQDTPIEIRVYN